MRRFAKVLNELLDENGMTQGDLAQRIGIDDSKVSRLINSVFRPSPEDLEAVIEAFDNPQERYRLAHAHIADELPAAMVKQLDIELAQTKLREQPKYDLLPPNVQSALEHVLSQYPDNDAIGDFIIVWARMLDWQEPPASPPGPVKYPPHKSE